MKSFIASLALCSVALMGCGGQGEAPLNGSSTAATQQSLTPGTVSVEIKPRIDGITVYAGYYGPGLPAGDPGYVYQTGVTKAAGLTFSVPGAAVCGLTFTNAKALDGVPLPSGIFPKGMEMKFAMPNGWAAGTPGVTPGDNEVAEIRLNGVLLAPVPIMTYNGSDAKNMFVSSWLFGCTP